jgi:hypothetical protein
VREVALSKVQKGAAHPQGGVASASNAVVEEEGAREGAVGGGRANLMTPKPKKATHRVHQAQGRASPTALAQSLPTTVPLKTSFNMHRREK